MSFSSLWPYTDAVAQQPPVGSPINWGSPVAEGLKYYWPLWDGHGVLAEEIVGGLHATASAPLGNIPTWRSSPIGTMLFRPATSTSAFRTGLAPTLPLPATLSCILMVPGSVYAANNRFLIHDSGTNTGYRLMIQSDGTFQFSQTAILDRSSGIVIPFNQPCIVAASASGNNGTVIWAVYNVVTGNLTKAGPSTLLTANGGSNQWTLGGLSWTANGSQPLLISDAMVHSRVMSPLELGLLVTPDFRWSILRAPEEFSFGLGTAGQKSFPPPLRPTRFFDRRF